MEKFDFKKKFKSLYAPGNSEFVLVDVPALNFLTINGKGNPNTSPDYANAVRALYSVAYSLKFWSKTTLNRDYVVPPLEGLWWSDEPLDFVLGNKDSWNWQMMLALPEWIDAGMVSRSIATVASKKSLPSLQDLVFQTFGEGTSLQILHKGAYSEEAPVLKRLHDEIMPRDGWTFNGHHHEIYLNNPGATPPEKLKTILRQPVKRV
jgi:hypothetical protein